MKTFKITLTSLLFLVFIIDSSIVAQSITLPAVTSYPCQSISVPVVAAGFPTDMGAVQFSIPIDVNILTYSGYTAGTIPLPTSVFFDSQNSRVWFIWSSTNALNINGTVVTLNFNYKGGTQNLTILDGEYSTSTFQFVYPSYVNGTVSPTPKTTYYVDGSVGSSGTGLSWASPLKTITEATNKPLTAGDEVLVKPNTYNEALIIKSNGSEIVPIKYGVTLSDTNKITFPAGTDLSCVSPASYPGKYYAYVYRSWKCNNGAYPILSVNVSQRYVIVDNSAFIPETGAAGDSSLVQACIGLPVFYKKYASNPETERVTVNSGAASNSRASCYIGTPLPSTPGTPGDSATAASYNVIDGFDLTAGSTFKIGLRIQSSSYNVYKNGWIYNLDSVGVFVSGSTPKPARYNIISDNKIYNTKQRAFKIGKYNGIANTSNYVTFTLIKNNEVYVQDDPSSSNDALWNMVDINKSTAFTVVEGNTFRSYSSQSAGRGTIDIWNNVRKTNINCNFIRDIGKSVNGTNAIIYVRNNGNIINVYNNVILNSSLVNDDIYAFRLNATDNTDSKVVYNTVYNIDNGILFEDSSPTTPVFKVQDNILYINYLNGGIYFTNTGTNTGRFTVSNNCYPTNPTSSGQPYNGETGRQVGDPQFVNPTFYSSPHGLQLKTGSICLGNGITVTGITRDYSKIARSASAPSIGSFETALTSISWTGKVSTDWHNYLNWNPEIVPTNTLQAVIPLKTNLPLISSSNAVCKGLLLQGSATVVINNSRLLNVY